MANNHNFNIGDHVYFIVPRNDGVNPGTIEAKDIATAAPFDVRLKVHDDAYHGSRWLPETEVFPDENDAKSELYRRNHELLMKYVNEIKNVNDLVRFMYSHTVAPCEEYTNWQARLAAQMRAKDLLGIDLSADA